MGKQDNGRKIYFSPKMVVISRTTDAVATSSPTERGMSWKDGWGEMFNGDWGGNQDE